jgi:C1A family cysteine protease
MWQKKYKDVDEFPDGMLPKEFDLRNIAGYDFTGPLRDQSECGSCFTMAYVQAIESRLRLKYAHEGQKAAQQVSPQ